jgi:hypothetical protein
LMSRTAGETETRFDLRLVPGKGKVFLRLALRAQ